MQEDGQANITKLTTEAELVEERTELSRYRAGNRAYLLYCTVAIELVEERTELSRYRAGNRADLLYYSSPQRLS